MLKSAASALATRLRTPAVVFASVVSGFAWCHSVHIQLSAPGETLSRNEPVLATLSIRNPTDEGVYLGVDRFGRIHVNVMVVEPGGTSKYVTSDATRTCVDCSYQPVSGGQLGPSEEVEVALALDRWHRFDAVGRYEVYVELQRQAFVDIFDVRADQVEERAGVPFLHVAADDTVWLEEPVLRSNTVTVDVGPRDEERLRTVANALWQRAKENDYAAQSALAWMVDPVAVPSLVQLLRGDYPTYLMDILTAAERAATPEAVDMLLGLHAGDAIGRDTLLDSLRDIAQDDSAEPLARQRAEGAIRSTD